MIISKLNPQIRDIRFLEESEYSRTRRFLVLKKHHGKNTRIRATYKQTKIRFPTDKKSKTQEHISYNRILQKETYKKPNTMNRKITYRLLAAYFRAKG